MPAMANAGSGNQGITATIPVCVVAQEFGCEEEILLRALALSHLVALYAHSYLPVLSAFCAADTAAMGSAAAICYLMGKSFDVACNSIINMAADAPGMVCDGAGCSCAMKVATAVSSMYRSVNLAIQGIVVPDSNGIVSSDVEKTIQNVGRVGSEGMRGTDPLILEIMTEK